MKTCLTKFRISSARDSGRSLPLSLQQTVAQSQDLQAFSDESEAVDSALKQSKPVVQPPPWLHARVMRAVQEKRPPIAAHRPLRWGWAPATALLLLFCVWQFRERASVPDPQPWSAPVTTTIETGQRFAAKMPAAIVSPLTDEWQHLNHDLTHATDFLLASLP
jgi:hypothetical protein